MPRKATYDEIKSYVDENSHGNCQLVSQYYVNSETKMEFICKCGNHLLRTFASMKTGNNFRCNSCAKKEISERLRRSLKEVIFYIKSKNCEYLSGEYINGSSPLKIKCSCGNIFIKDYNHFARGQNRCPQCGNKSLKKNKMTYNLESAREVLAERGYTLLSTEYITCETPLDCLCPNGHLVKIKLAHFRRNHSGCKICANENLKGANHWNYKGGESEVIDFLRKSLKQWKKDVLYRYNYQCALTDTKNDIVIHHLKSFSDIVKESCSELNLTLEHNIKDYSTSDFENLAKLVLQKHNVSDGIPLTREVHNHFHSIYGKGGNTKEQFLKFVKEFYLSKYDIILQQLRLQRLIIQLLIEFERIKYA